MLRQYLPAILRVDIPQRVRKAPSAVRRVEHAFDAFFEVGQQSVLNNIFHGFFKVGFKSGVVWLPHVAEGHRVFAAVFYVINHEVGEI